MAKKKRKKRKRSSSPRPSGSPSQQVPESAAEPSSRPRAPSAAGAAPSAGTAQRDTASAGVVAGALHVEQPSEEERRAVRVGAVPHSLAAKDSSASAVLADSASRRQSNASEAPDGAQRGTALAVSFGPKIVVDDEYRVLAETLEDKEQDLGSLSEGSAASKALAEQRAEADRGVVSKAPRAVEDTTERLVKVEVQRRVVSDLDLKSLADKKQRGAGDWDSPGFHTGRTAKLDMAGVALRPKQVTDDQGRSRLIHPSPFGLSRDLETAPQKRVGQPAPAGMSVSKSRSAPVQPYPPFGRTTGAKRAVDGSVEPPPPEPAAPQGGRVEPPPPGPAAPQSGRVEPPPPEPAAPRDSGHEDVVSGGGEAADSGVESAAGGPGMSSGQQRAEGSDSPQGKVVVGVLGDAGGEQAGKAVQGEDEAKEVGRSAAAVGTDRSLGDSMTAPKDARDALARRAAGRRNPSSGFSALEKAFFDQDLDEEADEEDTFEDLFGPQEGRSPSLWNWIRGRPAASGGARSREPSSGRNGGGASLSRSRGREVVRSKSSNGSRSSAKKSAARSNGKSKSGKSKSGKSRSR